MQARGGEFEFSMGELLPDRKPFEEPPFILMSSDCRMGEIKPLSSNEMLSSDDARFVFM